MLSEECSRRTDVWLKVAQGAIPDRAVLQYFTMHFAPSLTVSGMAMSDGWPCYLTSSVVISQSIAQQSCIHPRMTSEHQDLPGWQL